MQVVILVQELLVKARDKLSRLVDDCNTVLVGDKRDKDEKPAEAKTEVKIEVKPEPSENGIN